MCPASAAAVATAAATAAGVVDRRAVRRELLSWAKKIPLVVGKFI